MGTILNLFLFIFGSSTLAQAQHVEVPAVMGSCRGFLAKTSATAQTVYLFTAGHCVSGIKSFDDPNRVVIRKKLPEFKEFSISGSSSKIHSDEILYATYQTADFAVFKIKESESDLKKLGVGTFVLSSSKAPLQSPLWTEHSGSGEKVSCQLEAYPYSVVYIYSKWTWTGRMSPACQLKPGWSGAAVFHESTAEVLGLVSGGNNAGDCKDYCEVDQNGDEKAMKNHAYFTRLDFLAACLDSRGDIIPENCHL